MNAEYLNLSDRQTSENENGHVYSVDLLVKCSLN